MMLEAVMNSRKTKYKILGEQLRPYINNKLEEVTVYISLDCILKQFYNPKVNEVMRSLDFHRHYLLSSEIINIIAHYRHYFWSRHELPTNFFVYYSTNKSTYNTTLEPEYKSDFYNKRIDSNPEFKVLNDVINENVKLTNILSEYLPNIAIVDTDTLEPSALVKFGLDRFNRENNLNIVLSNNTLDNQYVNEVNTVCMTIASDKSIVYNKFNLYDKFLKGSKVKNSTLLSPIHYNLLLSITGYKSFNITGIKGFGNVKAITLLEKMQMEDKLPTEPYSNISSFIEDIIDEKYVDQVKNNYKIISMSNQVANISPKQFNNIKTQINTSVDDDALEHVNAKYYSEYPLQLIELREGEFE